MGFHAMDRSCLYKDLYFSYLSVTIVILVFGQYEWHLAGCNYSAAMPQKFFGIIERSQPNLEVPEKRAGKAH